MTETQAKSGAAGADLEPAQDSARPVTETPDTADTPPATSEGPATDDRSAAPEPSTNTIQRATAPAVSAPAAEDSTDAAPSATTSSPPAVSPPAEEAKVRTAATGDVSADRRVSSAPSAGPAPVHESAPTTRLGGGEPTVRAPGSRATTASTSAGPTTSATGLRAEPTVRTPSTSAPVGRATVTGSDRTASRTTGSSTTTSTRGVTGAVTGAAAVGAARVSETLRTARATVAGAASRGPRRARLHLKRIDPWSVMKFSFAVSLVLFVVAIVATSVLYLALDAMNVFDSVNGAIAEITGQSAGEIAPRINAKGVIGTSVLLGAVNMVLFTALATLGAFVYNVCADLVGGIELTLSEKE